MDVREKLMELLQDENNPVWNWFPNNMAMMQLADYLISNGVTVQEWVSVDDRLPEDASTVLAIDSYGTICSAYYAGRWHGGGDLDEDAVTYWMTLPTAPKEDK